MSAPRDCSEMRAARRMRRRDFLKAMPLGLAAAGIPVTGAPFGGLGAGPSPLLAALTNRAVETDRVLVLINLAGGNDGLNTVVPYADPLYVQNRPRTGFVSAADRDRLRATRIADGLALNPLLDAGPSGHSFLDLWRDGALAIVQNVGYPIPNLSHFRSTDIWTSASDSNVILTTGWVGRYLAETHPGYPFDVVPGDDPLALQISFALSPLFQGGRAEMGLAVEDPVSYEPGRSYEDAPPAETAYGGELGFIRGLMLQSNIYGQRFRELFATQPESRVNYPAGNPLARQLQKVAWCIARGMKTRVYLVEQDGYDTHSDQRALARGGTGQGELLYRLAEAIATFQLDLERQGLADRVVGLTWSEFGRRVNDNDAHGTDHGTAAPQFLFGAPVSGGLYGAAPDLADLDDNGDLRRGIDFRQLYAAVLGDWFGVSATLRQAILNRPDDAPFGIDFPAAGCGREQSLFHRPVRDDATGGAPPFRLIGHAPNPVRTHATIRFELDRGGPIRLDLFGVRGERLRGLLDVCLPAGAHQADLDATGLAPGVYFYRLATADGVRSRKLLVLR